MSQGKKWENDSAEKGRISKWGRKSQPSTEQISDVFGWGQEGSVWADPCSYQHLSDFHEISPEARFERIGFLAWDAAATQDLAPRKVKLKIGTKEKEFYSICGYKELMPHQHNFSNSSKMIKHLEECLIDDLTFHIFGAAERSIRNPYGMTPRELDVTGYTIRFADLPVTPKDNQANVDTGEPPKFPTNRVAKSRIYGAILIPTWIVDTAPPASQAEIILDPKKVPDVVRKVTKPPPTLPEFSDVEQEKIDSLVEPHGQFGLSPEKTRIEQLKIYEIAELELDPDLPIPNPQKSLSAKLLKWRSPLHVDAILDSLKDGHISIPVLRKAGQDGIEEDTWFVSYLTTIKHRIHPDPEFCWYDPEHDKTVENAVNRIYQDSQEQPEISAYDEGEEEEIVVQPWKKVPKLPPTRDLFSLSSTIGYYKTDSIPKATYPGSQRVEGWIVTVGVSDKKIKEAEDSPFSAESTGHFPPQNKFDWIPRAGDTPWRTVIAQDEPTFSIPMGGGKKRKVKNKKTVAKLKDIWWFVYESDWEYHALSIDLERQHRARQQACIDLYSALPEPRLPDYRVEKWGYAPMPFSDKAVILVGVRNSWVEMQPHKTSAAPVPLPPIAEMPELKNAPMPMLNWRKTFAPFPFWYDSNRHMYYGIKEAEDYRTFWDNDKKKVKLDEALEILSAELFEDIVKHNGKDPTPDPRISAGQYFNYFLDRSEPFLEREVHLEPRPASAPRVIVGIHRDLLDNLPEAEKTTPQEDLAALNEAFMKDEEFLILKVPVADDKGFLSFKDRMGVAAASLRQQAGALGSKKAPGGLTSTDLNRSANKVKRFLQDFDQYIVNPGGFNIDQYKDEVLNNTRDETGCEYYIYLDPKDYKILDVYAFNRTRITTGISDLKAHWSPPNNVAMQFVFWAGATYVKTSRGRKDSSFDDFLKMMGILMDPFGALGDLMMDIPSIPGLPDGFVGQMLANEVDAIKKGAAAEPSYKGGVMTPEQEAEQKAIQAALQKQMEGKLKGGSSIYNLNSDVSNPSALHEDPNEFFEGLSAAGCGQDLFMNILSKVNIFNLITLYLKCLGLELPIDLRCLFTFPWPLFDINIKLPWIFIPPITLAGLWEIIRKIIYMLLCQLIIQLLLFLVKEILEAVLRAGGCPSAPDGYPPNTAMPEAPFDFGPFSPKDMIDDAMADVLDPLGGDQSPEDFANGMFKMCQPGLENHHYGANRSALDYLDGLKDVLTGMEWCALLKGEATNATLDRVITFTKVNYPDLYAQEQSRPRRSTEELPEGSYIGWPRPPAARTAYRNFFMCLASFLAQQVADVCSPDALKDKYAKPVDPFTDDKCTIILDPQIDLDKLLKEQYQKQGLSDDDIAGLIKKAEAEAMNKMLALDNIQAAINEFLEVVVPKVTAPVVDSITMNAFDNMFRAVGIQMRGACERIQHDVEEPRSDLQMMVNFVVNGRDFGVKDKWWTYPQFYYRIWWSVGYHVRYAQRYYPDPNRAYWVGADPILFDKKFNVREQIWPSPSYPEWLQDAIRYPLPWWPAGKEYTTRTHRWLRRQYRASSHAGHPSVAKRHPRWARNKTISISTAASGYMANIVEVGKWEADFRSPRWWRNQRNLTFIQDYVLFNGTLGDVTPTFEYGKTAADGISSKLLVSNGKISFTVTLDKNGENFYYDIYRDPTSITEYINDVPDMNEGVYETHKAKAVETQIPKVPLLGDEPIEVELNKEVTPADEADGENTKPLYPWWKTRKVKTSNKWIQKDEFLARFIGDDHPLSKTPGFGGGSVDIEDASNTSGIGNKIFVDLHNEWYVKEVEESLIETIRRTPMEHWWLQEYYAAADWEDFDKNKPPEMMYRNRLLKSDDPYVKLGDIRAKARELMKD